MKTPEIQSKPSEEKEKRKRWMAKYFKSEKGLEKLKKAQQKYYKTKKGKEAKRRYYDSEKGQKIQDSCNTRVVINISDSYVISLIKASCSNTLNKLQDIPDDLIELKRLHLKLKRAILKAKKPSLT